MATYKKQLTDKDGNTIYPDVGLNLDDVVYSDDPTTPVGELEPWVTAGMIDFSSMYISAPDGTSNITVGSSGAIIQTLALPVGKWRVFSQFRLSAGGIGANTTKMFYTGFKYGDTISSTTINEIPMNISGDSGGSGRALVSMTSKEINVTVAPYTISSYVTKGDIPGSDIMVYANPGIYMYALRVG